MFREKMTYPPDKIPTVVNALASFKKSHALVRFTRLILLQKHAGSTTYWAILVLLNVFALSPFF